MSFLPHALFPIGPVPVASETSPLLPIELHGICGSLLLCDGWQPKENQRAEW